MHFSHHHLCMLHPLQGPPAYMPCCNGNILHTTAHTLCTCFIKQHTLPSKHALHLCHHEPLLPPPPFTHNRSGANTHTPSHHIPRESSCACACLLVAVLEGSNKHTLLSASVPICNFLALLANSDHPTQHSLGIACSEPRSSGCMCSMLVQDRTYMLA